MPEAIIIALISAGSSAIGALLSYLSRKQLVKRKNKTSDKRPHLKHHPLFATLDKIETDFITSYNAGDPGRTKLAVELVVNQIKIWRPLLTNLAIEMQDCYNKCKTIEPSCSKVYNANLETLTKGQLNFAKWYCNRDAAHSYEALFDNTNSKQYRNECRETMSIYMKKFSEWHSSKEQIIEMAIGEISHSPVAADCYDKQYDIFSIWLFIFVQMKLDADKSLKELNGDLTGHRFLGLTIGNTH